MAVALPGVTLPSVVEELLSEMAAAVQENAQIPDEHLLSLKFIFGSSAIQALDLVDRQSITLISSPSGRRVYQVLGSSGRTYLCLASCHYCSCPAFAFSVLRKNDSLLAPRASSRSRTYSRNSLFQRRKHGPPESRIKLRAPSGSKAVRVLRQRARLSPECKHLLAVYLSQVTRTCRQLKVSDKQLTDILFTKKKQEA
ncbi:zinc finger SWIM domain-containing protein 7 isoform X1 [Ailuropoda melanoleuca]|uniref:zinc finger SWIM domain-containing protein 7 isoform X1 n=1 Tax=Ailuropoda melanoleuca TaxID=9646 RepID=UPI0014948874|nr:zinc finger SWIM domain-containing protein 7 isoform X1 [Ailuropoda melanoleuca]